MNDVETQLRAEMAVYDPTTDIRNIPRAVARTDVILALFDHPDVEIRRYVAAGAMYAIMGDLHPDKRKALLEKSAAALTILLNGHAEPTETDVYVRERCAEVLRLAASRGSNLSEYITVLTTARDYDPHAWIRDKAKEALQYLVSTGATTVDVAKVARKMGRKITTGPTGLSAPGPQLRA